MRTRERSGLGAIALGGLTPLLDTLFILLFALLALSDARTSTRTEAVRVELPEIEPASSPDSAAAGGLVLAIDADSRVRLADGGELATREELDRALARLLAEAVPEEVLVEIHADRDARHGVAVELLQHLRLRGFVNVQLVAIGSDERTGPFGGAR